MRSGTKNEGLYHFKYLKFFFLEICMKLMLKRGANVPLYVIIEAGGEQLANDHTQARTTKTDKRENGNVP